MSQSKHFYIVKFEATTAREYMVKAESFEQAHVLATGLLQSDDRVSKKWAEFAEVTGMKVVREGEEFIPVEDFDLHIRRGKCKVEHDRKSSQA